jgi:hypothetical protein
MTGQVVHTRRLRCAFAPALIAAHAAAGGAGVIYVDDDAPPGGDGLSWRTAHRHVQDALADAAGSARPTEIRIAQGVYRPDRDAAHPDGTGDRAATFRLLSGVTLAGGYFGLATGPGGVPGDPPGEPPGDPDERDVARHESIFCGDLAGDDDAGFGSFTHHVENVYQVVNVFEVDATCVLDGVTLRGGYADGPFFGSVPESKNQGSAINIYDASPRILGCTIHSNWTGEHGAVNDHGHMVEIAGCLFHHNEAGTFAAGLFTHRHSMAMVSGCTFADNVTPGLGGGAQNSSVFGATYDGCVFVRNVAALGGGLSITPLGTAVIRDCLFVQNQAVFGGGTHVQSAAPTMTSCRWLGNSAADGGGLFNARSTSELVNGVFVGNVAARSGGAVRNDPAAALVMVNCSLAANAAPSGAAVAAAADVLLSNCVLAQDAPAIAALRAGVVTVQHGLLPGGWTGPGAHNLDGMPMLVREPHPGADRRWGTEDDDFGDVALRAGSPGVDAGGNDAVPPRLEHDVLGLPRYVDDPAAPDCPQRGASCGRLPIVDMGAFEVQAEARVPADLSGDGMVDGFDLALLLGGWGRCPMHRGCPGDLNGDGGINGFDLAILLAAWTG